MATSTSAPSKAPTSTPSDITAGALKGAPVLNQQQLNEISAEVNSPSKNFSSLGLAQAQKGESSATTAASTLGSTITGGGSNPFVSSSDEEVHSNNGTKNKINLLSTNNDSLMAAHNNYLQTLQTENQSLNDRLTAQLGGINAGADSDKAALTSKQANESGEEQVVSQRQGGYLGEGASQVGALISLNQTHQTEINGLEQKRQAAIQSANDAVNNQQFQIADAMAKESKDVEQTIADRKENYIRDSLSIQQADQQQADKMLQDLSALSPDDLKSIDPAALDKIDQAIGVPGFAARYLTATTEANQIKSANDAVTAQKNYLNLLQDIPAGQKITMPDGTEYTGLGKTADVATFQQVDDAGNVTIYSYNKGNGQLTLMNAGQGGKTKTQGAGDAQAAKGQRVGFMGEYISKIAHPADPNNPNSPAYISGDDYIKSYQKYIKAYPGHGTEFTEQFPVNTTVTPGDRGSVNLGK